MIPLDLLESFLSGAGGAALIAGIFTLIQRRQQRKDAAANENNAERKALRYILLYIIEERCKELIERGTVTLDELRSLHHWHEVYHDGLDGNGDADKLLKRVETLKLITD